MPNPLQPTPDLGSLIIRNDAATDYAIAEIGGVVLAPGATLDLMDYYNNFESALWAATKGLECSLCNAVSSSDIAIVTQREPVR